MAHENLDCVGTLHAAGHRVTRQRLLILDAVCEGNGHSTLKDVYARVHTYDETIDLSSLYRALKLFVSLGLVVSAVSEGETYYEITRLEPHHHLVCRRCGRQQEIGHAVVQLMFDVLSERYGFEANSDHLVIYGLCADCQRTA